MYKNILVAIALDHEHDVTGALGVCRALAEKGASITALTVLEEMPAYVAPYLTADHYKNRRSEAEGKLKAELGGVIDVKPVVASGRAGTVIVEYAADHEIDCIVIASHRPGLQDYFLGSTASRVVWHAPCSVHVVR